MKWKEKKLSEALNHQNVAGHQLGYEINRDYIKSKIAEMAKPTKTDPSFFK